MIKIFQKIKYLLNWLLFRLIDLELLFHRTQTSAEKKLLIIRIDAIGDFVIFSPMLKYYRELYLDHSITLLVNKVNQDLAQRFNHVDEVLTFERKKFISNVFYRRRLLLNIKKAVFNVTIYPVYSREPAGDCLVMASSAAERIGFDGDLTNISEKLKRRNDKYYTRLIKISADVVSELQKNKSFIELLGIKAADHVPSLEPSRDDETIAAEILIKAGIKADTRFAVVCLGAGSGQRIWPMENFAQVISWLRREKNVESVICGSPSEKYLVEKLKMIDEKPVCDIVGQTNLTTLAAILKKAAIYIGADTGPCHLAAAVGTSTACIVGGGHPNRFFPWGELTKNKIITYPLPCFGCLWICQYDHAKCVSAITAQQVIATIKEIM